MYMSITQAKIHFYSLINILRYIHKIIPFISKIDEILIIRFQI